MTIYEVWFDTGDFYEREQIAGLFSKRELAEQYITIQHEDERNRYSIEEYVLDSLLECK